MSLCRTSYNLLTVFLTISRLVKSGYHQGCVAFEFYLTAVRQSWSWAKPVT